MKFILFILLTFSCFSESNQTGKATVSKGGTGVSSLTEYAPIFGGTTSTGAVQSGTAGTAGQLLTSNGAGVLPTFQTAVATVAGGSDTYVQFNDGGTAFGGDAGFTYNKTSDTPTIVGALEVRGGGSQDSNPVLTAFGTLYDYACIIHEGSTVDNIEMYIQFPAVSGTDKNYTFQSVGASTNILDSDNLNTSSELGTLITNETGTAGALMFNVNPSVNQIRFVNATDTVTAATQTIGDSDENCEFINPDANYTLTSTPNITNGGGTTTDDTWRVFYADDAEANTVTVQDADTLASSGIHLASPKFSITAKSNLLMHYHAGQTTKDWYELARFPTNCIIYESITEVGNVGAGDDTTMSYSVPANTLQENGDVIYFEAAGSIAASVNAKRIRIKFGGTTFFDTGAAGIPISTAITWSVSGWIIRESGTVQKCVARMNTNNATLASYCGYSGATETLSSASTFAVTAEATDNNDVICEMIFLEYKPAHGN